MSLLSTGSTLVLLSLALGVGSCGSSENEPQPVRVEQTPATVDLDRSAKSNGGSFLLRWEVAAEQPPLNEEYGFSFALEDPDGAPYDVAPDQIVLDARMPHHGHGMNQDPRIERSEPGHYNVRGMRLHMTGHWEVYVDVRRGPVTERAEFVLELE